MSCSADIEDDSTKCGCERLEQEQVTRVMPIELDKEVLRGNGRDGCEDCPSMKVDKIVELVSCCWSTDGQPVEQCHGIVVRAQLS